MGTPSTSVARRTSVAPLVGRKRQELGRSCCCQWPEAERRLDVILTGPKGAVLARRSAVGSLVGRRTSVGRRIAVGRRSLLACRRLR